MSAQNLATLIQQQGERIILHTSESDSVQFERTLSYTESFLNKQKNNNKIQIEAAANAINRLHAQGLEPTMTKDHRYQKSRTHTHHRAITHRLDLC